MMLNHWIYEGKEFILPAEWTHKEIQGFVYCITNQVTGRKYIGKKFFWSSKSKQVKGKKNKFKGESDWKKYCGSSETLLAEITQYGVDKFHREILHLCKNKAECSYWETYEIFRQQALIRPKEFINEWASCKIRRAHLKTLMIDNNTTT